MNSKKYINKPKYQFFKNFGYAISGIKDVLRNEFSFKLDVIFFFVMSSVVPFLNESFDHKLVLFLSLFLPLFCEIINSAIERIVDLITMEYDPKAKIAKDVGSSLVLLSFFVVVLIWVLVLYF